jgi:hypothetical protein
MRFSTRKLRYLYLLTVIIALMVLSPLIYHSYWLRIVNNLVLTLVLLAAIYTVKENRRVFITGLILCIPSLIASWIHFIPGIELHPVLTSLFQMIFDGYIVFVLLRHIMRSRTVTADLIYGAISVYILLGVFFSAFYVFLDSITPHAIFEYVGGTADTGDISEAKVFYYSFVTLTTLGFGDIRPITLAARMFTIIEAMTGVLYSAALIGRMIGLYVAQSGRAEAAAEAASKAAEAAAAAAGAAAAEDIEEAAAAAETASRAAADAAIAAEAAKQCDSDEDCEEEPEQDTDR